MLLQEKSWSDPAGVAGRPGLVAQIFFPFDSAHLDPDDRRVLQALALHYRGRLDGARLELMYFGNTDAAGKPGYNNQLGQRRADAVKGFLDRLLGRHPNFTSWAGMSLGESGAVQAHLTARTMAQDRRVDVLASLNPFMTRGKATVPRVKRIVRRFFSKVEHEVWRSDPKDELGKEIVQGWMDIFTGSASGEGALGDESVSAQMVMEFTATDRVNRVRIDSQVTIDTIAAGGMLTLSDTEVIYEWGPAAPAVTVESRVRVSVSGVPQADKIKQTTVPRSEADTTPLLFPPKP